MPRSGWPPSSSAVCDQQPAAEMADRNRADVVDDDGLEVGERGLGEETAPRLDLAGDRERVPERLAEAVAEQDTRLLHVGTRSPASSDDRPRTGRRHVPERLAPGVERHGPSERTGRDVGAIGCHAAVHAPTADDVWRRIFMVTQQFVTGEHQRCHGPNGIDPFRNLESMVSGHRS